jgi:hypothetical protein
MEGRTSTVVMWQCKIAKDEVQNTKGMSKGEDIGIMHGMELLDN